MRTPAGRAPDLSPAWTDLLQLHPDGILVVSRRGGVEFVNEAAARILGADADELRRVGLAAPGWEARSVGGTRLRRRDFPVLRALRTGRAVQDAEVAIRRPDGAPCTLSVNAAPFRREDGDEVVIASVRDISAQRAAEERRRLAWEMVRTLSTSLDMEATVETVARLAVPALGDAAAVHVLEQGALRLAACRHGDPARQEELASWCARSGAGAPDGGIVAEVVQSGERVLLPRLDEGVVLRTLGAADADPVRSLGLTAALVVPLRARGETLGALACYRAGSGYDGHDLALAEELATHAALALDNARLYRAAEEAREEAERGRQRAADVLESISDAFFAVDRSWRLTYVNRRAETLLELPRGDVIGRSLREGFDDALGEEVLRAMEAAMRAGRPRTVEAYAPGLRLWVHAQVYPAEQGLAVYFQDVTKRREAEAKERLLTETGVALASSLEWEATLRRAADVAVPTFADLCTIDLLEGEEVVRVAVTAADPARRAALEEMTRRWPPHLGMPLPNVRAIEEGEATFLPDAAASHPARRHPDPAYEAALERVGVESAIVLPLQARGERIGAIAYTYAGSGRRYDGRDLRVAEELARRVALAIDNARLFRDAMASARAKSNFISVMSHEFRTPLTAIVGYAELLGVGVGGELNERQRQHVERIQTGAWHLTTLVDEILTYSRVEAGREAVEPRPLDAREVVEKAMELVRGTAEGKGLALELDLPAAPVVLRTDPHKLRQVLVNLLGNAVKFTARGRVTARLRTAGGGVRIEVEDTGIGIAPEHAERIFDSFWQVDQGTTRAAGGVGLGLTIARRLAELLGGSLAVESLPGEGSLFTVTLPEDAAPAAPS